MMNIIFGFLGLSMFLSLAYYFYVRFGLLDRPRKYGFDRKPVPYSFGLVLVLLFSFFSLTFLPLSSKLISLVVATLGLSILCFIDDFKNLNPYLRLLFQFIFAYGVVASGVSVLEVSNPFGLNIELGFFSQVISVLWIVFLTNIMNFLDGVSGLTSGVSSIGFFTLMYLAMIPGLHVVDQSLLIPMAFLAGILSLVGFLLELPLKNPKVLLGDSGSMCFGFLLACLSMINGGKLATLGIVLLIPIFDGLFVIFYRIYKGGSPVSKDMNHLHHKLLEKGLSRLSIVVLYMFLTFVFAFLSIFAWNSFLKFVTLILVIIFMSFFVYLTRKANGYQRGN